MTDYILPDAVNKPEYRDLWRARNRVAALMGALLFKRLESSIAAFRATLQALLSSNRNFKAALEEGFVPIGQTATRILAGSGFDAQELLEVLEQEEKRRRRTGAMRSTLVHSTDDFDVERWIQDLDADRAVLEDISARVAKISPKDDDKLQALREFMSRPELKGGKLLIFSEAEATVEYLYEQLNPGGRDSSIARLSGATRGQASDIVKRFSPRYNLGRNERPPGPDVQVLIATDVISEGQNLQDCARVLNYDLHWNPVRLIQRFGRVDRIGTEHSVINMHNMWPDLDVDARLNLTDRLLRRIQSFHDFIGLDSRLLSETERLNARAMYRIYQEQEMPDPDEGFQDIAVHQRALALLQRIQEEDPDLWETITNLPDGIRSAIRVASSSESEDLDAQRFIQASMEIEGMQRPLMSPSEQTGIGTPFDNPQSGETVVLLSSGGVTNAYAVSDKLEPRRVTPAQLVTALECHRDTPPRDLPAMTNQRVMAAYGAFKSDADRVLGRARRPTSDTRLRRYLSKQLRLAREQHRDNTEEVRRIDLLRRIFLDQVPPRVQASLRDIRDLRLEGDTLVRRLEALRTQYRLSPPDEEEAAQPREPEIIRIVCSDGLVS